MYQLVPTFSSPRIVPVVIVITCSIVFIQNTLELVSSILTVIWWPVIDGTEIDTVVPNWWPYRHLYLTFFPDSCLWIVFLRPCLEVMYYGSDRIGFSLHCEFTIWIRVSIIQSYTDCWWTNSRGILLKHYTSQVGNPFKQLFIRRCICFPIDCNLQRVYLEEWLNIVIHIKILYKVVCLYPYLGFTSQFVTLIRRIRNLRIDGERDTVSIGFCSNDEVLVRSSYADFLVAAKLHRGSISLIEYTVIGEQGQFSLSLVHPQRGMAEVGINAYWFPVLHQGLAVEGDIAKCF